jgi:GT2 family glycosyltransferase/2-polyprenyl-3-methyl-5-hydroxy-6-metoxy-1,4-benzoquinol methylase
MEFTGERYIPGQGQAGIAYEHLARYFFAQPFAAGKCVLDIGSGEGYGSHLLATFAESVIGVDSSVEAVEGATLRYGAQCANLRYLQGSATVLPLATNSVDLVVAFEILEHIADHQGMLAEVRRVLRPGGVFLVSTPNKAIYSDLANYKNPFHVRELYFDEFRKLLENAFQTVRLFAQKNVTGSLVAPIDETQAHSLAVKRIRRKNEEGEFDAAVQESFDHLYFVAACSDSTESLSNLAGVVLCDRDERLWWEAMQHAVRQSTTATRSSAAHASDALIVVDALLTALSLAGTLRMQAQIAADQPSKPSPEENEYDLIIPNFNAPDVLKRCLDSLIANTSNRHLIHVVDDASTDPRVDSIMRTYVSRNAHVRYYRLPVNIGFPGAVNMGFATTTRDVVLVNSDTEFPPDWLARMDRCRRSDFAIHTISPLSNNATICSVPNFNEINQLPQGLSIAEMDQLVQRTSLRRYPRVPTVVGFCMLITRRAIREVGPFDMVFGRGYGEEVDWCQRAWAKGLESAICDDLYVYHHGGIAFSQVPERQSLREANQRRFEQRWPMFSLALMNYCALNPLRYQLHRLAEELRHRAGSKVRVLQVTHAFGQVAGVEMFTRQLIDGMRDEVATTVIVPANLSPYQDAVVEEEGRGLLRGGLLKVHVNFGIFPAAHSLRGVSTSLRSYAAERFFADTLMASGAQIVQFNHFANLGSFALPLIARALGVKVVVVLHDYFLLCPDWNLLHSSGRACGEARADADSPKCVDCLRCRIESRSGVPAINVDDFIRERTAIARAILEHADVLVAPSAFVRDQFTRAWGETIRGRIRVLPHGTPAIPFQPGYEPQQVLRIAFLGNATYVKGIDTFVEAANRLRGEAIRFRIVGAILPGCKIDARDNVAVGGSYVQRELSRLLQDIDAVYIGSLSNETYCYTLDEAFRAGVPVIASAIGAIPERVVEGKTGLLISPCDPDALVSAILRLERDRELLAAMRKSVGEMRLKTSQEEVAEYLQLYRDLVTGNGGDDQFRRTMSACTSARVEAPLTLDEFAAANRIDISLPLVAEGVPVDSAGNKKHRRR